MLTAWQSAAGFAQGTTYWWTGGCKV